MPVYAEQKEAASNAVRDSTTYAERLKDASSVAASNMDRVEEMMQQEIAQVIEDSKATSNAVRTLIFFDWDDTLLSSTFLAGHGYRLDTDMESKDSYEFIQSELKQLELTVVQVLSEALSRGKVHIVTNAEHGWVELSARKFIPGVLPLLDKITVISARSTFEHLFPDAPFKWKYSAFQEQLTEVFAAEGIHANILSFGDSNVEREAIRSVTQGVECTHTKSVKFAEGPTAEQLRKQLEQVNNHFDYLHSHEGDLDLMLKLAPVTDSQASP